MRKIKLEELKSYIEELKTIKKEEIEITKNFITTKAYACTLNNGKTIIREKIIKGGNDGSASIILPITSENNVILVVEPRVLSKRTVGVGLPSGYIEKKESPKVGALRELQEEIGYTPSKLIKLGSFYQDIGCMGAYNHMFLALDSKKTSNQNLDEGEYIRYFECTYKEALELIKMKYIEDGNALLTFEKAKKYVKGR